MSKDINMASDFTIRKQCILNKYLDNFIIRICYLLFNKIFHNHKEIPLITLKNHF